MTFLTFSLVGFVAGVDDGSSFQEIHDVFYMEPPCDVYGDLDPEVHTPGEDCGMVGSHPLLDVLLEGMYGIIEAFYRLGELV